MRHLFNIAVFLAVGLVLSILVAWFCTGLDMTKVQYGLRAWPPGTPEAWVDGAQADMRFSSGARIVDYVGRDSAPAVSSAPVSGSPFQLGPGMPAMVTTLIMKASVLEAGWPWTALRSRQWAEVTPVPTGGPGTVARVQFSQWGAGIRMPWSFAPPGATGERRLPVQPVWPGLALNAAFWGLVAAAVWHIPWAVRWAFRRRCGLCAKCGYPAATGAVCSECGARVRPWVGGARPPMPETRRRSWRRRIVWTFVFVAGLLVWGASGQWGIHCKGPGGWFASAWHGQCALGRADRAFERLGIEVQANQGGWRLGFDSGSQLVGKIVGFPLWFPLPIIGGLAFAAAWRAAVRRALALYWQDAPVRGETLPLAGGVV